MKTKIKTLAYYFIYYSGLYLLFNILYRWMYANPIRILYAHRIIDPTFPLYAFIKNLGCLSAEDFEDRIKYLKKRYKIISLDEYSELFNKKSKTPPNLMVLTFDDGYECLYRNVFPVLKRYGIPATVFLTIDSIENNTLLFHDRLLYMIATSKVPHFYLPAISPHWYSLKDEKSRIETYKYINSQIKKSLTKEKEKIISALQSILQVDLESLKKEKWMLSWRQINEMYVSGLVSFGAHTLSHPILTHASVETIEQEIIMPKTIIEEHLKTPVKFIAYPNGRSSDYNDLIKALVKKSGYSMAFTTLERTVRAYDSYEIPRYGLVMEPYYVFGLRMSGFFDVMHALKIRYTNLNHILSANHEVKNVMGA